MGASDSLSQAEESVLVRDKFVRVCFEDAESLTNPVISCQIFI